MFGLVGGPTNVNVKKVQLKIYLI